ncbi:hypothetical protein PUNSTDRAFT_131369 [Punctularia strigosozonata HHB-11173 SS5]|uniref:uncharacterized protein n=1 Tax=Punctularia strigosozonata (strain HHB-11173) TaxID=741275 RepID=UPI0004417900|nr:uncharacterized protein PUNSTDRAFT_131369 [Punctularia strigosozonata HHB-11173 SS5]EIN11191.1 hypothetical protein PUNSTDRAFT_131369 [Punctularia strigosozonata HHB-11173 SS5]
MHPVDQPNMMMNQLITSWARKLLNPGALPRALDSQEPSPGNCSSPAFNTPQTEICTDPILSPDPPTDAKPPSSIPINSPVVSVSATFEIGDTSDHRQKTAINRNTNDSWTTVQPSHVPGSRIKTGFGANRPSRAAIRQLLFADKELRSTWDRLDKSDWTPEIEEQVKCIFDQLHMERNVFQEMVEREMRRMVQRTNSVLDRLSQALASAEESELSVPEYVPAKLRTPKDCTDGSTLAGDEPRESALDPSFQAVRRSKRPREEPAVDWDRRLVSSTFPRTKHRTKDPHQQLRHRSQTYPPAPAPQDAPVSGPSAIPDLRAPMGTQEFRDTATYMASRHIGASRDPPLNGCHWRPRPEFGVDASGYVLPMGWRPAENLAERWRWDWEGCDGFVPRKGKLVWKEETAGGDTTALGADWLSRTFPRPASAPRIFGQKMYLKPQHLPAAVAEATVNLWVEDRGKPPHVRGARM